jgi:hypothetical protein
MEFSDEQVRQLKAKLDASTLRPVTPTGRRSIKKVERPRIFIGDDDRFRG